MFPRKFSPCSVVIALLLCASFAFSQRGGQHKGSVEKFIASLPGYAVVEGTAMQLDPLQLCCNGQLPTALFFNRSAPYVAFNVQSLDSPIPEYRKLPIFQLRPDEAVVLIGVTPPAAQFFSYQPYLLARFYPPDYQPKPVFASIGDTINVSTVKTLGPGPFNHPVVFILTPDQGTEAQVRGALRKASYPDAIINTLPFPAPMLNLGLNAGRDDIFLLLHRMAMFTDKIAGQAYLDAMQDADLTKRPLRVFRITPTSSVAPNPFPTPPLRVRGTGRSEMDLTPALARLRQGILDYWQARGYKATEFHPRHTAYDGDEYIQRQRTTLGDTRDSLYMVAGFMPIWDLDDDLTLGENDFLVVYGPKHVATGKATYTNINVYASEKVMLSLGSVYSDSFEGSAYEYLGRGDPASDLMYAYKFARQGHCSGDFCLPLDVPSDCTPWCKTPPCPPFIFGPDTKLGLFLRNYLEPPTRVGPAPSEILYDQVIKFSPE